MVIEIVLLQLGTVIARRLLTSWLGSDLLSDAAVSGLDEASDSLGGHLQRRRAKRMLDRLAEDVTSKLEAFTSTELGGLAPNEQEAAIAGVTTALERADLSDRALLEANFDPSELEEHIRGEVGDLASATLLSGPATALYDTVLTESCSYLVELRSALASYPRVALTELLQRESATQDMLREVLDRLPQPAIVGYADDPDARFELKYRRKVASHLDRLQLFGVTVADDVRRYALSVAYVSLAARHITPRSDTETSRDPGDDANSEALGAQPADQAGDVRIDAILTASDKHLLRGEAGSGKTTLLQWLAVKSARNEFSESLEPWNHAIPLFIQLRGYVGVALPRPENLIDQVSPNLVGLMPDGWVHRLLDAGRALVLIDGVDELPIRERDAAHAWLIRLTEDFPGNRFVVTTRPPAVSDDWLKDQEFSVADLQPMEMSDIEEFVAHWHESASQNHTDEDRDYVLSLAARLMPAIRSNTALRSLATNPLLCAMLCALHRDRQTHLPSDRLELYRIALEMLVERRDIERELSVSSAVRLSLPQKLIFLRDYAFWLLQNDRSSSDSRDVVRCIDRRLPGISLPGQLTAEGVFRYLLERSGVMRQPVENTVDFIHRTFQEFLAAEEIIEQGSIDMLINHAHLDQWREVVVLGAGLARPPERESLIRGLVERGMRDEALRHRLHLLAVACLETARELQPDLRQRLATLLATLVPPTNMSDARACLQQATSPFPCFVVLTRWARARRRRALGR